MSIKNIFIINLLLLININLFSQNKIEELFDETVGKENLPLNNGYFYFNTLKSIDTHPFLINNNFIIGELTFENQNYYSVNLKYDIFRDLLVFKPFGESENYGVVLIEKKISEFKIYDKKFINLSLLANDSLQDINGFYEENLKTNQFTFFIKHKKERREFEKNQIKYNDFEIYNTYLIYHEDKYYRVKNKSDIVAVFPKLKSEIKNFYNLNTLLLKENKTLFYEKLFPKILES